MEAPKKLDWREEGEVRAGRLRGWPLLSERCGQVPRATLPLLGAIGVLWCMLWVGALSNCCTGSLLDGCRLLGAQRRE